MELGNYQANDTEQQQEKQKKQKQKIQLIILIVVVIFILLIVFVVKPQMEQKQEEQIEQEQQAQEDAELQQIMSEPHTARSYYFNVQPDAERASYAVASLIAHVINTGCKTAYSELMQYFDKDSMEYLYDFVGGYTCGTFEESPYVLQEEGKDYKEFKIRFNTRTNYILHLNLDENQMPVSFVIMYYDTRDNILAEGAVESKIQPETTVKSKTQQNTTTTTETTTDTTTTETTTIPE